MGKAGATGSRRKAPSPDGLEGSTWFPKLCKTLVSGGLGDHRRVDRLEILSGRVESALLRRSETSGADLTGQPYGPA
jgi:hypothetical protein